MNFFTRMLSDNRAASFGRVGACTIVTIWLLLCTYLTIKTNAVVDIPLQWAGLATLLFGITKAFSPDSKKEVVE